MPAKISLGLAAAALLGGATLLTTTPTMAQGFSLNFGAGPIYDPYDPPPPYYRPRPHYRPYGYGAPVDYLPPPPAYYRPRCHMVREPIWNGFAWVPGVRRVCG